MTQDNKHRLCYTGYKDNFEITIGWRELDCVVDAIKEYKEKYKTFDDWTEWTFDGLIEALEEQNK